MSNFRNATRTNFTIVDNNILERSDLSWRAKGLLIYLLSRPNDWRVYTKHLVSAFSGGRYPSGKEAVQAIIKELIETGYIIRDTTRNDSGRFEGISYLVFAESQKNKGIKPQPAKPASVKNDQSKRPKTPERAKPAPAKPAPVEPEPVNPPLINTNLTNTDSSKKVTNQKGASEEFKKNENGLVGSCVQSHLIGEQLTDNQKSEVVGLVNNLIEQGIKVSDPDALAAEIRHCLLDKRTFSQSQNIFTRKLGAIRSTIIRGKWTRPASMRLANSAGNYHFAAVARLKERIRLTRMDIFATETSLTGFLANDARYCKVQRNKLSDLQQKLQKLLEQLAQAEAGQPQAA